MFNWLELDLPALIWLIYFPLLKFLLHLYRVRYTWRYKWILFNQRTYSETKWIEITVSSRTLVKSKDIRRVFNAVSSMNLIKNDLSGLAGSWSVSVHAAIARTDLEERERWNESRSPDKIRRAFRELKRTVRGVSGRNVQSSCRIAYMRLEILSRWRTAYAPDTGPHACVRKTTVVREERVIYR